MVVTYLKPLQHIHKQLIKYIFHQNIKKMNCKEINNLNPIEVLEKVGVKPYLINGNEALFCAPYRTDNTPSLSYNLDKGVWLDFATGQSGKMVDLLVLLYQVNSISEMLSRFNKEYGSASFSFSKLKEKKVKSANPHPIKVISIEKVKTLVLTEYLKKRGLSRETWEPYLKEIVLQKSQKTFYNLAFKNDSGGYELRNPAMKNGICIGTKDITTFNRTTSTLLIFEGFFDFLSYIELGHYTDQSIIVLNSVVNTSKAAQKIEIEFSDPNQKIFLYLDNDQAGKLNTNVLTSQFKNIENRSDRYIKFKDLNEYLITKKLRLKKKGLSR